MTPASFAWVKYVLVSMVAVWIGISLMLFTLRHPAVNAVLFFLSTALFLFLLDRFDGSVTWYYPLGLPILAAFSCITLGTVMAIRFAKERGFNMFAFVLIAAGLFCMCIDIIVDYYMHGAIMLSWSLIVAASVLPVSIFLLYLHYHLKKKFPFDRIFHL
jgi:hypothetical protein